MMKHKLMEFAGAVDVDEGLLGSEASRWHHQSMLLVAGSYSSCIASSARSLENCPSLRGPLLEELGRRGREICAIMELAVF